MTAETVGMKDGTTDAETTETEETMTATETETGAVNLCLHGLMLTGSGIDMTKIGTVGLQTASLNMTPNLQPTGSEIVSTLQQVCGLSAYSDPAAPILTLVL